jgi:nucleoid DNA-binding protein
MDSEKLTKADVVAQVRSLTGHSETIIKEIVQETFVAIAMMLQRPGSSIEIRNFATFANRLKKARNAHNPQTGDSVHVPEHWVVTIKPSKKLHEAINKTLIT